MNRRILPGPQAYAAAGRGKTAFHQDILAGLMVRPVPLGRRAVGWPELDIAKILALRAGGGSDNDVRRLVNLIHLQREREGRRILDEIESAACTAAATA